MAKEERLRSEIDEKYKWDLTRMYKNEDEYKKDFDKLSRLIEKIGDFRGIITESPETLYEFMKLDDEISTVFSNLYVYANCKKDEDVADLQNQKRMGEVTNLLSRYDDVSSFVNPELLSTSYDIIKEFIKKSEPLKEYAFDLEEIYRYQPYVLSEKEEKLLSNIGELQNKFETNFSIVNNSLIDFGYVEDEHGEKVKLTNGNYSKYIKSSNRRVRRDAYALKGEACKKFANLISVDYEASVKADSMIAKARNYQSNLQMYLFPDGVTEDIYNNLLMVADKNLPILHKYYKLIKDVLKLDELCTYDLSAPLIKESNKTYTPEAAKELIVNAVRVFGDEYVSTIKKAFDERWIDFYPNKGKRSGYYQNDSFKGIVVFGNYNDDYASVSSLAHELGHAMHSYYSMKNNENHLSQYTLLVAEIVSLTNEMILSNYVINNTNDKDLKLQAINNILSVFASNFYGTLCEGSVFEKVCHEKIAGGVAMSEDDFNKIFGDVIKRYNGSLVKEDEYTKYSWVRISHFYTPFYYYKYSIGVCGACFVAKNILSGNKEFLNKYMKFLTLGGSMRPLDELKTIGIDFTDTKVIEEGISYFDELIDKFIEIYNS